jgi:hypothetical protein
MFAGRLILSTWSRKACGVYGMQCVSWGPWAFLSGTSMVSELQHHVTMQHGMQCVSWWP